MRKIGTAAAIVFLLPVIILVKQFATADFVDEGEISVNSGRSVSIAIDTPESTPSSTPIVVETLIPTSSPTSTSSPIPTNTPEPTMTPTPKPVPYRIEDGFVVVRSAFHVLPYDPSLCWKVPDYMIKDGYLEQTDPTINCSDYDPNTIHETWMWSGAGIYIPDNYGIMAACPQSIGVLDFQFVNIRLEITTIGRRWCIDSGGALDVLGLYEDPTGESKVPIPHLDVDILHNLQIGYPNWKNGVYVGYMYVPIDKWEAIRGYLDL